MHPCRVSSQFKSLVFAADRCPPRKTQTTDKGNGLKRDVSLGWLLWTRKLARFLLPNPEKVCLKCSHLTQSTIGTRSRKISSLRPCTQSAPTSLRVTMEQSSPMVRLVLVRPGRLQVFQRTLYTKE